MAFLLIPVCVWAILHPRYFVRNHGYKRQRPVDERRVETLERITRGFFVLAILFLLYHAVPILRDGIGFWKGEDVVYSMRGSVIRNTSSPTFLPSWFIRQNLFIEGTATGDYSLSCSLQQIPVGRAIDCLVLGHSREIFRIDILPDVMLLE